jgi:glyoxylase-like metal-dependent hydrolase (beta-lactamase superfamily II)
MRTFLFAALAAGVGYAQMAPGYVDPEPVLRAAEEAIGARKLRCVSVSGEGYTGAVGQQRESGWNIDWPKGEPLRNYTRVMNWEAQSMTEEFDRAPGKNPASWKYGLGWMDGTPWQKHERQRFAVRGLQGWHQDGSEPARAAAPRDAERWQLDLWMNPPGFLKAARMPGANPRAVWRWELGESGRDGHTGKPEKVTVVGITVLGKYRVDATINQENLIQRIHTWVPDPVLGDTNYEHEFSNDQYADLGDGIRFPATWHHHEGWDDNFGAQAVTAGHNAFGGTMAKIVANACPAAPEVPAQVRGAAFPVRIETRRLAEGVYLLKGESHNSVAVEFKDYIAVVEAPVDEAWNLKAIEEITRRIPDKPVRFLVNTHQHFDHAGGLRTYMHIGATIITHWKNFEFYRRDVLNYAPRTLEPDMISMWPPTELAEGYQYETVRENYTLTDGKRTMHISYVQPLAHAEGMLMAYLPEEKMAIEADLDAKALEFHVKRLGVEVRTVVRLHGEPVSWAEFPRAAGR